MKVPQNFEGVVVVDDGGFLHPGTGWRAFTREFAFGGAAPQTRGAFFGTILGNLMKDSGGWAPVDSAAFVDHTLPPSSDPEAEQLALAKTYMATRDIDSALSRVATSVLVSRPGDKA